MNYRMLVAVLMALLIIPMTARASKLTPFRRT